VGCTAAVHDNVGLDWPRKGGLVVATTILAKPARSIGGFFGMSLDIFVQMARPPFAWREFIEQCWFVARVSTAPALALTIPFNALISFQLNILLIELGAADLSGVTAALAVISQVGPFTTVVVVAGAAATATCADLGSRTIREEIDALKVLGLNPLQRLAVPRVLAITAVSLMLFALVAFTGLISDYFFAVYIQNVTPGAFMSGLTLLVGIRDVTFAFSKAALFGLLGGLIACYKGLTVGGGAQGVGTAVNETVVYAVMALFMVNTIISTIASKGIA
jgi:phospholipid/cholesterol/gamma-HCH transport system permease protein